MTQPINFPIYLPEDREQASEGPHLTKFFWTLLAATTVLRLAYACKLPLTGDEAYFWEWARHPALGYYDHPPMAGWILWFTRLILGDTVLAIRLPAVLAGSLVTAVVFRFTFDLTGSRRAASLTGILAMAIPLISVFGVLYSTDTPLLASGTLGGYLFYLAVVKDNRPAWAGAGACFAVIFASKFLGAPLVAASALYLVLQPQARRHLRTRGPYIALVISLTGLIPVIIWNAGHDWATFAFNFSSRHSPPVFGFRHLADYLAGQALALSPVVLVFTVPVFTGAVLMMKQSARTAWHLPAFLAAVPLGGFLLLSLVTKVGLHWPGVGVPFLAVALGASRLSRGSSRRFHLCILSAWTVTAIIFILPLIAAIIPSHWEYPLRPDKINSSQLRKYTSATGEIGETVAKVLGSLPEEKGVFTFTRSYALSSLVAFYTPGHPEVTVLGGGSAHGRNHIFWFDPARHREYNAVFVTYSPVFKEEGFLRERFQSWEPVTDSAGADGSLVSVIKCYGYNGKR